VSRFTMEPSASIMTCLSLKPNETGRVRRDIGRQHPLLGSPERVRGRCPIDERARSDRPMTRGMRNSYREMQCATHRQHLVDASRRSSRWLSVTAG
jgi:hypothetical protein